jgi:hypothetical protein
MNNQSQNIECCPKFDPSIWDDKFFEWNNKKFIKGKVFTLFYIPMNFGSVMKKLDAKVRNDGAVFQDWLSLSDHTSKWNMNLYLAVDKEVSGAENTNISGKFYCKVYEGDFKETVNWCKGFESYTKGKNLKVSKQYMWYTTCPKCAKKYGKNYVAIVGKVE